MIDEERGFLEIVFLSTVTRTDIVSTREQIDRENRVALAYDSIVDLRQGSMNLTTDELRDVARGAREKCMAIVAVRVRCPARPIVPRPQAVRALVLTRSSRVPRLRSLGEACALLGLDRAGLWLEEIGKS